MERILIPTDFSAHAERAVEHGADLASLFHAEIELMTSVFLPPVALYPGSVSLPAGYTRKTREQALERLELLAKPLRDSGLGVACRVASEEPATAILERADEMRADLIAMGTRGHGLAYVLFGSVTGHTARLAHCPVLTVHEESPAPRPIRNILVPTDFSDDANAGMEWARVLADRTGAKLVVMHSYALPTGVEERGLVSGPKIRRQVEEAVHARLSEVTALAGDHPVELVITRGRPDATALEAAREYEVDLIVIGTRGLTGLPHVLLGSTAERIIRDALPPVVAVKAGPVTPILAT